MTVTYLGEDAGGRKATNSKGKRNYTRVFKLSSSSKADAAYHVGSNANLPKLGDLYPQDWNAYCHTLDVENSDPWRGWTVTASYNDERAISTFEPQNDEIKYSFSSEIYQEEVFVDKDGNAICNSAGCAYLDPPATRDNAHLIARIEQNVPSVPVWVLSYQNALNLAACNIGGLVIAAKLAKIQRIEVGPREYRNTLPFYPLTLEIHIHLDGWGIELLDIGFRVKGSDTDKRENAKNDADSSLPATMVALDGSGGILSNPTAERLKTRPFDLYPELPFGALPGIQ